MALLLHALALLCVVSKLTWAHGGHHADGTAGKPLEFASEVHNKEHILEHLQRVISTKPKDQLTDEELEFHYFKLHDYDNNNKLDGVEIGKALTHFHDDTKSDTEKNFSLADDELETVIEDALKDDLNGDGYVEYYEFSLSQRIARSVDPYKTRDDVGSLGRIDEGSKTHPPSWNPDDIKPTGYNDDNFDGQHPAHVEVNKLNDFIRPKKMQEVQGKQVLDSRQVQGRELEKN